MYPKHIQQVRTGLAAVSVLSVTGCLTPPPPSRGSESVKVYPVAAENVTPFEAREEPTPSTVLTEPSDAAGADETAKPLHDPSNLCPQAQSSRLASGLHNPMPGGKPYSREHGGIDIMGDKLPLYAVASGTFVFSEWGHTSWKGPKDTPYSILIKLDKPFSYAGKNITHVYYTHLSRVRFDKPPRGTKVAAGECIGVSGYANGAGHLHLTFVSDNDLHISKKNALSTHHSALILGSAAKGDALPPR